MVCNHMDKGEGCGVHLMELRGKQVNKVPLSLPRLSLSLISFGLHQRQCGQQAKGGNCPLYSALLRPHLQSCNPGLGPPTQEGCVSIILGPEEGCKVGQRSGAPLL